MRTRAFDLSIFRSFDTDRAIRISPPYFCNAFRADDVVMQFIVRNLYTRIIRSIVTLIKRNVYV